MVAASLKNIPKPTGPYKVGITKYDLNDPSRKEIEYTTGRLIPVQLYFPMRKGPHTLHKKIFEERTPGIWPPLDVEVYGQKAELTFLATGSKHPVIFLNHGNNVAMTDYASIAEDLASHGYIVVAIQHQLETDPEEPKFLEERSISKYGRIVDNILYVFEWLRENQIPLFNDSLDLQKIGLIGHSMGGNALLLFANRVSGIFTMKQKNTLLPHTANSGVQEAIIVLDPRGVSYPNHSHYPLFLLLSEEHEENQKKSGTYADMIAIGHQVTYYKGSTHISFMDHGYICPENPVDANELYFNGNPEERRAFFDQVRNDIRDFLRKNRIIER